MRRAPLLGGARALGGAGVITLTALFTDGRIEGRATTFLRHLPAFASNFGVELGTMLAAHSVTTLFPYAGEELGPVFLTHRATSPPRFLGACNRTSLATWSFGTFRHGLAPS